NAVNAPVFNVQTVDTTVVANDGETVALGGLISKSDEETQNKIPWFGDLPYVGYMFKFTNRVVRKRELLVIMTPHVVQCPADADGVLAEESRRIDWVVGDVLSVHGGGANLEAIIGKHEQGPTPVGQTLRTP